MALIGAIGMSMYLGRSHLAPLMVFLKKDNPHHPLV